MHFLLKARPADFIVSECMALSPNRDIGSTHHYLRMRKCGYRTLDAANSVADYFAMDRAQIGCAGLKDEDAITEQYISVPRAITAAELLAFNQKYSEGESYILLMDCRCTGTRLSTGALDGNSFRIIVRGLSARLASALRDLPGSVGMHILNYYDTQRFGVPNAPKQTHFIGRALLDGDFEGALQLLRSSGTPEAEAAICYRGLPAGFFGSMDPRIRAFYLCSHASFDWNRRLRDEVRAVAGASSSVIDIEGIEFVFANEEADVLALTARCPTLAYDAYRSDDGKIERHQKQRTTVLYVRVRIHDVSRDELCDDAWKCEVSLFLPSGVYATNALRQFLLAADSPRSSANGGRVSSGGSGMAPAPHSLVQPGSERAREEGPSMGRNRSIVSDQHGHGRLVIEGGHGLAGTVRISGFKHALVSLFGASCAGASVVEIHNCPELSETANLMQLMRGLGGDASWAGGTLRLDARGVEHGRLDPQVANRIHGSVYLAPALVARTGEAVVATKGGCPIGNGPRGGRPVEHYVSIFKRFGAQAFVDKDECLRIRAKRLIGCDVDLLDFTSDKALRTGPLYSGASKMALLTAAVARGPSKLRHLYPKPDVTELVAFLRELGVEIEGGSTDQLVVYGRGVDGIATQASHTLIGDLIETVTWICAGAVLCRNRLRIEGTGLARAVEALHPEMAILTRMGVPWEVDGDALVVMPMEQGHAVDVLVTSPGVYSDSHPLLALLATLCRGRSRITETVWQNRFDYVRGLVSLGARIDRDGASVVIHGGTRPHVRGQTLQATDVRSAAVLLLAALAVDGVTIIEGTHHLDRGYADLPAALRNLGASIGIDSSLTGEA
jgi:UDP-N-acetylglucosamine 1-carboxyvinyltransferase